MERNRATVAAGLMAAAIGAVAMAGVRLVPFHSALGFLLGGAAVAALGWKWRRGAALAAAGAALVGVLALLQEFAGIPRTGWVALDAGRMPPNAALCLVLAAWAVWLLARGGAGRRGLWAALAGSLVTAMGASGLLGYATGLTTYQWGQLRGMALPGAAAVTLLGGALLWEVRARERRGPGKAAPPWLFAPVGLAVLVVTVTLWQALREERRVGAEQDLGAELALVRSELAGGVERRIGALVRCARRAENSPVFSETDWEVDARLIYADFRGFQALAWAGPDRVTRRVVPPAGNQALLGRALGWEPRRRAALEAAIAGREARMSRPVDLTTGGRGVHVYVPVFRGGRLAGVVAGFFRLDDLLASVLASRIAAGDRIWIYEGGEPIYGAAAGGMAHQTVVSWAGASWLLRLAAPAEGAGGRGAELPTLLWGAGVLLAVALSAAVHLAQATRRQRDAAEAARGQLSVRVGQQKALAELGRLALAGGPVEELMAALAAAVREGLGTPLVEVLETGPAGEGARLRAGVGWRDGLVGSAVGGAGAEAEAHQRRLAEHGVVAGIRVIIAGRDRPFGVLGAHSPAAREFGEEDVHFLEAAATLLGTVLERQRAESELDQFFELSPDLLCVADRSGRFRRVNPACERTLGYSREELLARPFLELVHPEDRAATERQMAGLAAGRGAGSFDNRCLRRDGSCRWLLWNATAVAGGTIFAAARDITEMKSAEAALRQAHAELERRVEERTAELANINRALQAEIRRRRQAQGERDRFFALSRDLIAIVDTEGRIRDVNPAWQRVLGYPSEELHGRAVLELVHSEDVEKTRGELERVREGGEWDQFETRCRTREGAWRWLLWSAIAVPEEGRLYAAARDITERRQAQEELRAREEKFRRLFEDAPIGTVLAGTDGRIQRANPAFCRLLGYTEAELAGRTEGALTDPEDAVPTAEAWERLARGEASTYRLEKRYVRRDGTAIWVAATGTAPRRDDGGVMGYLGMIEDITERRQREREIGSLNAELARRVEELTAANRELEAFTYSVSHDLRAPLRHVDGYARLLMEQSAALVDDTGRHYLEQIRHGARRMGLMVDELLSLSRVARREVARRQVCLRTLVEEAWGGLQPEAEGRRVEIRVGELPYVDADPALVRQALVNLLENALKFTRPRAEARIEVGQVAATAPPAIYVRDNGVGFNMKYAEKLFGVFQRLHRAEDFEGTGIGLATVQRIVQKHGGRVWAEGELERGATFYFTLEPAGAAPQEPAARAEAAGAGR